MTYDRLVAILFPLKARAFATMKVAKILTFAVVVLSSLEGFSYIFAQTSEKVAHWLCPYYLPGYLGEVYALYGATMMSTSCVLLIIANILIAWSLRSNAHRIKLLQDDSKTHPNTDASQQRSATNRQISRMLILVSCFYLVSNFPREIERQIWARIYELGKSSPDLRSLSFEIDIFFTALNYAVNFYLYVASSQKFRSSLRRIMTGEKSKIKTLPINATK